MINCWRLLSDHINEGQDGTPRAECESQLALLRHRRVVPNQLGVLDRPEHILLEDRPRLAEKYGGFLANNVIPIPLGAAAAMLVAGVRNLSEAVEIQLAECRDSRSSQSVNRRVLGRFPLIRRVFAAHAQDPDQVDGFRHIDFQAVSTLTLKYSLHIFGEIRSVVDDELAYYEEGTDSLYFKDVAGDPPWAAIARECALSLLSGVDYAQIVSGIKDVLSATDYRTAESNLDEMGFAPLLDDKMAEVTPSQEAQIGGRLSLDGDEALASEVSPEPLDESQTIGDEDGELDMGDDLPRKSRTRIQVSANGVDDSISGDGIPGKEAPINSESNQKAKRQEILRSYVTHTDESTANGAEQQEKNLRTDKAGIQRVLEFERSEKRNPTEMEHHNHGYDVESVDESGEIQRYIEVKSIGEMWGARGVGITDTQFHKARALGDRFWLYIVEDADGESAKIYQIQDPVNRITRFMFDDGWRDVAEKSEVESRRSGNRSILDLKAGTV